MDTPSEPSPRSHVASFYFAFSFGLAALLAVQVGAHSPRAFWIAALAAVVAGAGATWIRSRTQRGARSGPLLALATLNLITLVPELGLRSAGFRYVSGIQFGYPSPSEFWEFELDQDLFWKLPYDGELSNSLGFFGPEPTTPKPPGMWRVLMLGDSCSQQGHPFAWPEIAAAELARATRKPAECVNLALSGYSSHQGRVVAERYVAQLTPDLVIVYYGWNDHWLARGAVDADKRVSVRLERLYRASVLLQAARKMLVESKAVAADAPQLDRNRVPLEDYRANLERIAEVVRASGAKLVFVTAPTTHDLGVPSYLIEQHFVRDADSAQRLHREYNDVVRALASSTGAPLLDLEAELAQRPDRRALFLEDGIHFTEAGRFAVAQRFVEFARANGLAP